MIQKEESIITKAKREGRDSLYPHETTVAVCASLRQVHRFCDEGKLEWFCVSLGNLRSHRRIYIASIEKFRSNGNGVNGHHGQGKNGHLENGRSRR